MFRGPRPVLLRLPSKRRLNHSERRRIASALLYVMHCIHAITGMQVISEVIRSMWSLFISRGSDQPSSVVVVESTFSFKTPLGGGFKLNTYCEPSTRYSLYQACLDILLFVPSLTHTAAPTYRHSHATGNKQVEYVNHVNDFLLARAEDLGVILCDATEKAKVWMVRLITRFQLHASCNTFAVHQRPLLIKRVTNM